MFFSNVNLGEACDLKLELSSLLCLRSLTVNHCSLVQMSVLKGQIKICTCVTIISNNVVC